MTNLPLNKKTAWVTGASRGIGRAIAVALARSGAVVCAGARSLDGLHQLEEVMRAEKKALHPLELNVASRESVDAFAAKALEAAGPPSIVVNNAGLGIWKDIDLLDPKDFEEQIDVNLKGPWYVIRAAVPHLKRLGSGHIINVSSIAGRVAFKRGTGYCASKAGLNAMSDVLMQELREFGIKVTVIAPGSVETGFHAQALPSAHHGGMDWMLEPETIAEAVLHVLALPENALTNYYEVRPLKPAKK
ncbi:SDR family NAD(P)-dependent oxidoreductase [Candidatus Sumerlaeota bacterium]|nr:SDR family NAD(P)-dependent oxidoreductase [Candidatus Sumerlaeota bacterium]